MATTIELGYFTKRVNSTKKTGFSGTSYDCILKEPCSINNPVFTLKGSLGNYNYLKWSDRYYWVDDTISFPNGIIEVHAHMDPLATYQSNIVSGYAYCLYADSTHWNKEVDDIRMQPEKIDRTNSSGEDVFDFSMTPDNGTIIMTVMQCGASGKQGVCTYALSITEFIACLDNLYGNVNGKIESQTDIINDLNGAISQFSSADDVANFIGGVGVSITRNIEKFLSNVIAEIGGLGSWRDNVIRCVYVPIEKTNFSGNNADMYIGAIRTPNQQLRIKPSDVRTKNGTLTLPWGSKQGSNTRFLTYPRFQNFQVSCMGGYYQNIDSRLLKDHTGATPQVSYFSSIDICSGDWSVLVNEDSNVDSEKLASFSGNCGIDITGLTGRGGLGFGLNSSAGALKLAGSIMSMGLADTKNSSSSASIAAQIGTGIATNYIDNGCSGSASGVAGGGISSMFLTGNLGKIDIAGTAYYPEMLDTANSYSDYCNRYGYPCNKYLSLSSISAGAYVVCSGASIECPGNQQAQAYINSVLNSGIYLES